MKKVIGHVWPAHRPEYMISFIHALFRTNPAYWMMALRMVYEKKGGN